MVRCTERLSLFAAPATLDADYDIGPEAYEEVTQKIRTAAPFVVLDLPHVWSAWKRKILLSSDDLVIVATNDKEENRRIKRVARARHLLTNVADTPDECDFYLSSIVKKGNLKVAISTNGLSPTLAKRLREVLTEALPDDLETAMEQLKAVRDTLRGDFAHKVEELNRITEVLVKARKPNE